MKLEIKKNSLVIIPENPHDETFITDSLKLEKQGDSLKAERVDDIAVGFKNDKFCIKIEKT